VDIILEMLANVNLSHDTKLLANIGRIVVIGSRGEVTINPRELMGRRAPIRGFTLWAITPEEEADIYAGIFAGLENGTLRPIVGKELPLAEAARAHKEILESGSAGSVNCRIRGSATRIRYADHSRRAGEASQAMVMVGKIRWQRADKNLGVGVPTTAEKVRPRRGRRCASALAKITH
jgi:hypothetical protein